MLNRRFLRVKVLQHLYMLLTINQANKDMVIHDISNELKREVRIKGRADAYKKIEERQKERQKEWENEKNDINFDVKKVNDEEFEEIIIDTNQPLDKKLKERIDNAIKLFNDNSKMFDQGVNLEYNIESENINLVPDFSVENIVKKGVLKYKNLCKESYHSVYNDLISIPSKVEKTYRFWIGLLIQLKKIEDVIPLKSKVFSHQRYLNLGIIEVLSQNNILESDINFNQFGDMELVLCKLYNKVFHSKNWVDFLEIKNPQKDEEITLLNGIIRDIFYQDKDCLSALDIFDNNWEENKKSVRDIIKHFFKNINLETHQLEMPQLSNTWEEYFEFMKLLFKNTSVKNFEYEKHIIPFLENWTLERIARIDLIIIKMALTELLECQNIPVKVTINEYIDIGKKYSTRESQVFINGLLHNISNSYLEQGKIKKTGRGSIDNK